MASFKESSASRPSSFHRPTSSSTTPMNVPARHGGSRHHGHSTSLGALNHAHRVTRRKSMTSNNLLAVTAAVQGIDEASLEAMASPDTRALSPRSGNAARADSSSPAAFRAEAFGSKSDQQYAGSDVKPEAAAAEGHALSEGGPGSAKGRNRRASESTFANKGDAKRISGELRCEKCGKGYKHSSCLTKHLWEHTPEWSLTSKLLISKHQQVQLLEAASVLLTMNQEPDADGHMRAIDSDNSSASPEASGSSELPDDDVSSVETTPPPTGDQFSDIRNHKRYSSTSSVFSRSYQSVPGTSIAASSVPSSSYGSFHYSGYGRRSSNATAYSGLAPEDEAGLAAAVKLCNFGTPRTVPAQTDDVPPVPPLPARYASHNATRSVGNSGFPMMQELVPHPLTHRISDERDVKMMGQGHSQTDEHEFDERRPRSTSHGRGDEHDDGFFGRMEE